MCVYVGTGKREKEGLIEEESGKTECVSKDGASGVLLRIEI